MRWIYAIVAFLVGFGALASDLPVTVQESKKGYAEFPVVPCPGVKKKYSDILSSIKSLQQTLESQACQKESQEIRNLEAMINRGRSQFIELLKKGTNAQLERIEIEQVRFYIDSVVQKVADASGVISNGACFSARENKVSALNTLSSIVSEVSLAVGSLAGDSGVKITVGGQLAASLLSSLDKMITDSIAYDYTKIQDRVNYLTNLCAYVQLKSELDEISNPALVKQELDDLSFAAEKYLHGLGKSCESCRVMVGDFKHHMNTDENFVIGEKQVDWRSIGFSDLLAFYAGPIDFADQDVREKQKGPGFQTVKTLRTLGWAASQIERIVKERSEDAADPLRGHISSEQERLERFLIDDQGDQYVENRRKSALKLFDELKDSIDKGYRKMNKIAVKGILPTFMYSDESEKPHHLRISQIFETREVRFRVKKSKQPEETRLHIRSFQDEILVKIERIFTSYRGARDYCDLFKYARIRYNGPAGDQCRDSLRRFALVKTFFGQLAQTSFANRYGDEIRAFNAGTPAYTKNWIESTTKRLSESAQLGSGRP